MHEMRTSSDAGTSSHDITIVGAEGGHFRWVCSCGSKGIRLIHYGHVERLGREHLKKVARNSQVEPAPADKQTIRQGSATIPAGDVMWDDVRPSLLSTVLAVVVLFFLACITAAIVTVPIYLWERHW